MSTDIPQIYYVKQKSLYEINELLNLKNRRSNQDNVRQIINELHEHYDYEGEYDTRYIREFLKIYNMTVTNELDRYIRELKLENIKNVDDKYHIDKDKYNQLRNPHYTAEVTQHAQDILQQIHIDDSEEEQAEQEQISIPETTFDELIDETDDEQNSFLTNKDMTEPEPFPRVQFANDAMQRLHRKSIANIGSVNHVDLANARSAIQQRQRNINPNLHPRSKKNKYGITGMDDLIRVVVNLKNDVKQIREAQSVESANDWIQSHGYSDLYNAVEEDLDDDGYPEVVVKDNTGKNVIVNGYTTEPSLFPYRKQYYSTHPTKASRKNNPWKNYIKNEFYHPAFDATGRTVQSISEEAAAFDDFISNHGYTRNMKPKKHSSYQAFTVRCITPFYQALKYLSLRGIPFKLAQLSAYIWKEIVRNPALVHVYGENVLQEVTDAKELTKLCNQREVKDAIENIVVPYISDPKGMFEDILPIVIDEWRQHGFNMSADNVKDFILASYALVNNVKLPNRGEFNNWRDATIRSNQRVREYVEQIAQML